MNESDFNLVTRAKRQIEREAALRSFLWVGLMFSAVLRMLGIEMPYLYLLLFVILFVSLVLNSEVIASFGMVSKKDLVRVIEKYIHNDPTELVKYAASKQESE